MATLDNLKHDTYCRLKCSKVHGVGVFAIKDIPRSTNPFKKVYTQNKAVCILDTEIRKLDPEIRKLVKDFTQKEDDGKWYVPLSGFNSMDISFYINHNDHPNLAMVNGVEDLVMFKANRNIKKGEELTINYKD